MTMDTLTGDLLDELRTIPVIDGHEHLPPEADYLKKPRDFYALFEHYCEADLVSAGATPADMTAFADRTLLPATRWQRFRPFYAAIRTGSYARAAQITIRDILGIPDLNDSTYEAVSRAMKEIGKPGLYDHILRDRCHIAACINCLQLGAGPFPGYIHHLADSGSVLDAADRASFDQMAAAHQQEIGSLDDLLICLTRQVEQWRANPKVVGIKSIHAYGRQIGFRKTPRHEAEAVFNRIRNRPTPGPHENIPLQDFLIFELVARAEAAGLPMVFHTGLQAGNFRRIADAHPLLLQPLIEAFPAARFDLYHGGMPWVREIAVLAKHFPGVHLNMAWMHIINPVQARAALSEWLEMVPNTKIFGFGGDYAIVEKVYGHLAMARENIARVLAEKVRDGVMNREEAGALARQLMFDNPNAFYRLGLRAK